MSFNEETHIWFFLERTPVSTDASIVCDDWLKDARIIVSMVFIFRIKSNVTTLVANQVLIVWWNQQVFIFAESSRSAILM